MGSSTHFEPNTSSINCDPNTNTPEAQKPYTQPQMNTMLLKTEYFFSLSAVALRFPTLAVTAFGI